MAARCPEFRNPQELSAFLVSEGLAPEKASVLACRLFPAFVFLDSLPDETARSLLEQAEREGVKGVVLSKTRQEDGQSSCSVLLAGFLEELRALAAAGAPESAAAGGALSSDRVAEALDSALEVRPGPVRSRSKCMDFSGRPLLMGVLNVTPDSFSDGGRYLEAGKAVERARRMIQEGADILDLGGASSRPGSDLVPDRIQLERILPVIHRVREEWDGWISVDTYSSTVARAALEAGADMINDISAGAIDPAIMKVVAVAEVPVVLMHMKGTPKTMQLDPSYKSLFGEMVAYFEERIRLWEKAGVPRERILIDPGIGFGKTVEHNLRIVKHLGGFRVIGRPIVLGTSRKSFIGTVLNRAVEERLVGSLATVAVGIWNGAHVLRVHDVAESREVLLMVHAILKSDMSKGLPGKAGSDPKAAAVAPGPDPV